MLTFRSLPFEMDYACQHCTSQLRKTIPRQVEFCLESGCYGGDETFSGKTHNEEDHESLCELVSPF